MNFTPRMLAGNCRGRVTISAFAACCLVCGLAAAVPADAAAAPLTPSVYCVATSLATGLFTAYFGYVNPGSPVTFDVGDANEVIPGDQFEGQPTTFDAGSFPSVFDVTFDQTITPSVSWILDGLIATASAASPPCEPGTTTPASDVTDTAATLNGVVNPNGIDVSYTFEYGTTPAYGSSTTVADAGAGQAATLVQAPLSGLSPGTPYYFRLDTTTVYPNGTGEVTINGAQQQFTTAATPAPAPTVTVTAPGPTITVTATPAPAPTVTVTATPSPAPTVTVTATPTTTGLTLNTTALPAGVVGARYRATLSASGGTLPYTWRVTRGFLPLGLRLDAATGALSGRPWAPGVYPVTITVTDSSAPARESLSERFTIRVRR